MGKNTSVSSRVHFENVVYGGIAEEERIQLLKKAIQEGIDSGIAINFDPVKHLQELKSGRKANG